MNRRRPAGRAGRGLGGGRCPPAAGFAAPSPLPDDDVVEDASVFFVGGVFSDVSVDACSEVPELLSSLDDDRLLGVLA